MLVFAVGIDLIPFVTGDFGSIVDWILDTSFFFFVSLCLFLITMDLIGSFEDAKGFIDKIYAQRRLKLIPEFEISRPVGESSKSATLKIKLEVEGYYL